jgi:outer membrane protein OmpA-like peptidoglycan-associated protein
MCKIQSSGIPSVFFFILALYIQTGTVLRAQPFRVYGKIRCYKTKELIPAKVTFEKQPDAGLTFISQVSEEGYTASIVRPGTYLLKASLPGYIPELHKLNLDHDSLKSKDKIVCDFNLVPIMIDEILPFRNILFEPASSVISRLAQPELGLLLEILKENPKIFIRLEGHTDNVSKSRRSLSLAKKRIKAVKKYLTDNSIRPERIELKAFGGGNPLVNTGNIDAHKINRRVEIRVTAL